MTVASVKRHSSIAIFASLLLVAFLAQLPAISAAAKAPSKSAWKTLRVGVSLGVFDPSAQGRNSQGVRTGAAARTVNLMCFGHRATIIGTSHADRLYGTTAVDVIVGLGGDDLISSGQANDFICGGVGDDQMYGLGGNDQIDASDGADTLYGGDGNDKLYGDGGNDTVNGEGGTDYIWGGNNQDTLFGGVSGDATPPPTTPPAEPAARGSRGLGGDSNDFIYGGPGGDTIDGGDMNDNTYGQGGNDTLMGDDGDDRMIGGPGRDVFIGGAGNDTMTGGPADDSFDGEEGNDTVYGDGGLDVVAGGAGQDTVYGGSGNDLLNGGIGGDTLHGDGDNDLICGGDGVDSLYGADGTDIISGEGNCDWSGKGLVAKWSGEANLIDGGAGADVCVSPSASESPQTVHCESALFTLTVTVVGTGGYVDSATAFDDSGQPVYCDSSSSPCTFFFLPLTAIDLDANATSGSFSSWSGVSGCGVNPTCSITMNNNVSVTATFGTTAALTVVRTGTGAVTSSPAGIVCPPAGTCTANFATNTTVTLTSATAVTSWAGSGGANPQACGTNTTCAVNFTAAGSVTVNNT